MPVKKYKVTVTAEVEVEEIIDPPITAFPAYRDSMFFYMNGSLPVPLLDSSQKDKTPKDGSLYVAVANSIGNDYEEPNGPVTGSKWNPQRRALELWWKQIYGQNAGTRMVFSRWYQNQGLPIGLLPYRHSSIFGLIDFSAPILPIGPHGNNLWLTWPAEWKSHDFYGPASIACNIDPDRTLHWVTSPKYKDLDIVMMTPFQLVEGKEHRLLWHMDMYSDQFKGAFTASIDGQEVVHIVGPMALPSGPFAGCAAFIPCLYGNRLTEETRGFISGMILATEPI